MRPPCTFCARKHLAQALVLLMESRQGYPQHLWLAIGHLAEAADELIGGGPAMRDAAHRIRQERKTLEHDPSHDVPILDIIQQVSESGEDSDVPEADTLPPGWTRGAPEAPSKPRDTSPRSAVIVSPVSAKAPPAREESEYRVGTVTPETIESRESQAATKVPCSSCEEAKRKRAEAVAAAERRVAEIDTMLGQANNIPRLLLITTLSNFNPSYSLTTVILDQAHAAALSGFRVTLIVMETADLTGLPPLPPEIRVLREFPLVPWKDDVTDQAVTSKVYNALVRMIQTIQPHIIIEHDMLFQAAFVSAAQAWHRQPENDVTVGRPIIYHMAHSAPPVSIPKNEVIPEAQAWRRHLPPGHFLLTCNADLAVRLAAYYSCSTDRIKTLPNARDIRAFLNMPPLASEIVTKLQLHRADIVQIYPIAVDRWIDKGVKPLLKSFKALVVKAAESEKTVRLVLATAHANGASEQKFLVPLRAEIEANGLSDVVTITSDLWPATTTYGLPRDVIRSLFAVSNLFLFPTISEAASLILREAALSGCLLVLNSNVPQLKSCIPTERAWWHSWPALGVPQPPPGPNASDDWLARAILDHFNNVESTSAQRYVMSRYCLEEMGQTIRDLAGLEHETEAEPVEVSPAG
jgi:hypothetical protein